VKSIPFGTEIYFSKYEFSTPHLLSVSDCESMSIVELLELAGDDLSNLGNLRLGYTESQGHPELRSMIAQNYESAEPEDVIVLGSPIEGIYLVMQTLLEAGDHVVVLTPAYDALINLPEQLGASVSRWSILPTAEGWEIDLQELERLVNEKTRLIVVNFPHNPTGFLPANQQFSQLIDIAKKHSCWLYFDEMYRGLELEEGRRLASAVDRYERSIVLAGLSKTHGLPGLRAGWLVTHDAEFRDKLMNWKFYTSICPAAPTELLSMIALSTGEQIVDRNRAIVKKNVGIAESFFKRWSSFFEWRPPAAGSVALVGVETPSATAYCHELAKEAGVLLLPSTFLGYDDHHVRFGFGRKSFPEALAHYDRYLTDRAK